MPTQEQPRITREEVLDLLKPYGVDLEKTPIVAFGIRGYRKNTMGVPGANDHGIYDDAFGVLTPEDFIVVNANTDPTAKMGAVKGRAVLKPGRYDMWRLDLHRGRYMAFCQRVASCIVYRMGTEKYSRGTDHDNYGLCLGDGYWEGWFGINGHEGGDTTTGSEGCQTMAPPQWKLVIDFAITAAKRLWRSSWRNRVIPYILLENK